MKRWIALGIAFIAILAGVFFLRRTAIDPGDFTGEWYRVEDGRLYRFQEGIIDCPEDASDFCGAYFFCRDRILLFMVAPSGESRLCELYPAGEPKGEFLSESPDGSGRIVFSRSSLADTVSTP